MHLVRCKDQKTATLEEFYRGVSHGGKAMISLIARLRALPDQRHVYGLTSLSRLVLLAEDVWTSPWFVIISALDERNYFIEYLMPKTIAPWLEATVRGTATSEDEALRLINIAMEKSEGWRQKL
jgi:hypothetical protein